MTIKRKRPVVLGNVCNFRYIIDCAPVNDPDHILAEGLATIDTCGDRKAKERLQAHYHKVSHDCKVRSIRNVGEVNRCTVPILK